MTHNPLRPLFYTVTNRSTGKVTTYTTGKQARRAADRQDLAYGAIICSVKPHWPGDVA